MGRHFIIKDGTHKRESKKYGKLGKPISEYTFQEKLLDIGLTERELGWVEKSLDIEGYDIDNTYYIARINGVSKESVIKQFLSKSIRVIPTFSFPLNREFISFFWESVDWEKAWQYFENRMAQTKDTRDDAWKHPEVPGAIFDQGDAAQGGMQEMIHTGQMHADLDQHPADFATFGVIH